MQHPRQKPGARGSSSAPLDSDAREFSLAPHANQARLRRRARFARQMVFEVFRARDAKAIDYGEFKDRLPSESPRLPPGVALL